MEFNINPTTGVPIYQQLIEQVCAAIARGRLPVGHRLPSVRELSQTLVINPNTVARAYTELERQGALYTRRGLGVFVRQQPARIPKKARRERLLPEVDQLLVSAVRLGFTAEEVVDLVDERLKQFAWQAESAAAN